MSKNDESEFEAPFEVVWNAITAGSEDAQSQALQMIIPRMLSAVQRRFGSSVKVDADDATQSAVRTLQRRNWKCGVEPRNWGDLVGILVRFAYNKARTQLKKRREEALPDTLDAVQNGPTPQILALRAEMQQHVRDAMAILHDSLSEMDRVILKGKFDGLSVREIASELEKQGIFRTEDALRMRWNRNIASELRRMLEGI